MAFSTDTEYSISDVVSRTTLQNSGGISETDTSFDVQTVAGSVPPQPFLIAVWEDKPLLSETSMEMMEVTAISGTTLSVVRGKKGTVPKSFSDGDLVMMAVSHAGIFDKLINQQYKSDLVPVGPNSILTVDPFYDKGKFTMSYNSSSASGADASTVAGVLLLDCQNADATVVSLGQSTVVENVPSGFSSGTGGSTDTVSIGVRSDGKIDIRNQFSSGVSVNYSIKK